MNKDILKPFGWKAERAILDSYARINLVEGAVRSGKTAAFAFRFCGFMEHEAPPGILMFIGKTKDTIIRNVLEPMRAWFTKSQFDFNKGGHGVFCGRPFEYLGANNEEAASKIQGGTWAGCCGDEVSTWPESVFKQSMLRLSPTGSRFFGTTNPDSPYHWLKTDYIDRAAELDINVFHFLLRDNPHLDPAYVAAITKEYTGLWYDRFILGLWRLAEGLVLSMWDEAKHVVPAADIPKKFEHYGVGIDYGTVNPCVFILFGWDGSGINSKIYRVKEFYYDSEITKRPMSDPEYLVAYEEFVVGYNIKNTVIDPSAASFALLLKQNGHKVILGNNSKLDGIRFVAGLLFKRLLVTAATCVETIKEHASYIWDAKKQKLGIDEPIKKFDHTMDATRYFLYTLFGDTKPPINTSLMQSGGATTMGGYR